MGVGYRYINQLGETFYHGMRESLTISTYFKSIITMCLRLRSAYNGPKFVLGAYLKLFILGYDEIIILIPKYGQIF